MPQYPNFEQAIRRRIVDRADGEKAKPTYGMILAYNKRDNTATVLLSRKGSDNIGETIDNVPCPTERGIKSYAPEYGRMCWVVFKDDNYANPMITHFFSSHYDEQDRPKYNHIQNTVPRFMTRM